MRQRKSIKWSSYLLNSFLTPSDYAINPLPFKYLLNNSQTRKFFFFFFFFLCSVLLFNELERAKFAYNQLDCHKSTSLLSLRPFVNSFFFFHFIRGKTLFALNLIRSEWVTENGSNYSYLLRMQKNCSRWGKLFSFSLIILCTIIERESALML